MIGSPSSLSIITQILRPPPLMTINFASKNKIMKSTLAFTCLLLGSGSLLTLSMAQNKIQKITGLPFPPQPLTSASITVSGAQYGNGQYSVRGSSEAQPAFQAFDKNQNTAWQPTSLSQTPKTLDAWNTEVGGEFLEITMAQPVFPMSYRLSESSNNFPNEWGLLGSNDGNVWQWVDYRFGGLSQGQPPLTILVGFVCLQDLPVPIRVNPANGNVECMSQDGRDCLWQKSMSECDHLVSNPPQNLQPLQCGEMHKQIYGDSAYTTNGHWCSRSRDSFNSGKAFWRSAGVNYPLNDIGYFEGTTRANCEEQCRLNAQCVMYVMDTTETKCWIKNKILGWSADGNFVSFTPYRLDYFSKFRFIYVKSNGNPASLSELTIMGQAKDGSSPSASTNSTGSAPAGGVAVGAAAAGSYSPYSNLAAGSSDNSSAKVAAAASSYTAGGSGASSGAVSSMGSSNSSSGLLSSAAFSGASAESSAMGKSFAGSVASSGAGGSGDGYFTLVDPKSGKKKKCRCEE